MSKYPFCIILGLLVTLSLVNVVWISSDRFRKYFNFQSYVEIKDISVGDNTMDNATDDAVSFGLKITPLLLDNTTFPDILKQVNISAIPVPNNLHIVLLGDSLTRFQYLSFVYFLRYGTWIDPNMPTCNPTWEATFGSWSTFYNLTKAMLSPYEQCDCYRFTKPNIKKSEYDLIIENRYYLDADRNTSVTYMQKFGPTNSFKSMWNATEVHNEHILVTNPKDVNYIYKSRNWTQHICNFVSKLNPKPTYFVFNEGIWVPSDQNYYSIPDERKRIIQAVSDAGMISVYKTSTKPRGFELKNNHIKEYEKEFCELADYCLDLSWTIKAPNDVYWDNFHFNEPVYKLMNIQMMELLSLI